MACSRQELCVPAHVHARQYCMTFLQHKKSILDACISACIMAQRVWQRSFQARMLYS